MSESPECIRYTGSICSVNPFSHHFLGNLSLFGQLHIILVIFSFAVMHLLVIGGSGRTGKLVAEEALKRGA